MDNKTKLAFNLCTFGLSISLVGSETFWVAVGGLLTLLFSSFYLAHSITPTKDQPHD